MTGWRTSSKGWTIVESCSVSTTIPAKRNSISINSLLIDRIIAYKKNRKRSLVKRRKVANKSRKNNLNFKTAVVDQLWPPWLTTRDYYFSSEICVKDQWSELVVVGRRLGGGLDFEDLFLGFLGFLWKVSEGWWWFYPNVGELFPECVPIILNPRFRINFVGEKVVGMWGQNTYGLACRWTMAWIWCSTRRAWRHPLGARASRNDAAG